MDGNSNALMCEITNATILMTSFLEQEIFQLTYTEGRTAGNKKWLHLSWFGHHPLHRCCLEGRAKFYLQYKSSTKKSSIQTANQTNKQTNKQTKILWNTVPVKTLKYIHLIKQRTTCLKADISASRSQPDHILHHTST
jgi:hypothetical protein